MTVYEALAVKLSKADNDAIHAIVERGKQRGIIGKGYSPTTATIDIHYVVATIGMRLQDWLESANLDFSHDLVGIANNLDRDTGEMRNAFHPRFAHHKA